jgi:hypothetical protein
LENSRLNFLGLKQRPFIDYFPKFQTINAKVLLISAGAIEGHFEGRKPREIHQGCLDLA